MDGRAAHSTSCGARCSQRRPSGAQRDARGECVAAYHPPPIVPKNAALPTVIASTNQEIDVTAAQLSQLGYQSGSGADTLWVRSNDGAQWSPWSNSFTVTAPIDSGPLLTRTNASISSFANQNFSAASLFTYDDPFVSPAVQYDFWNGGGGGGHFVLNGTALPSKQDTIISAAQLGQLSYQVGNGSDTLWVKANDGTTWGNWSKSFTISDPRRSRNWKHRECLLRQIHLNHQFGASRRTKFVLI